MSEQRCENCCFFEAMGDDEGRCLRYPPVLDVAKAIGVALSPKEADSGEMRDVEYSAWTADGWVLPFVKSSAWCGEWSLVEPDL